MGTDSVSSNGYRQLKKNRYDHANIFIYLLTGNKLNTCNATQHHIESNVLCLDSSVSIRKEITARHS